MQIVAILLALSFGGTAQAVTTTVTNASQLVAAVNTNNGLVSGGNTILMNSNTYALSSSLHAGGDPAICLDISRPLILQANTGAAVTVTCSGNFGIRIQSSNVTLDGFSVTVDGGFGVALSGSNLIVRRLTVSTAAALGQGITSSSLFDSIIEYCNVTSPFNAIVVGPGSSRNLVVNNSAGGTTVGHGIVAQMSDYNTIAGNTISNTVADGVFVNGGQHNYVGQNTVTNVHNGVVFTKETASGRLAYRNLAVNNLLALNAAPNTGADALWFNYDSNYNLGFLNEGYNSSEAGFALFNSVGNYFKGNNLHDNPFGGVYVSKDPGSGATNPIHNSIQQNYLHDYPANGGIITNIEGPNDYGFNYLSGQPAQVAANSPIAGILLYATTNSIFYSNVIRDLLQGEQIAGNTTGATFYLNRHFNTVNHYVATGSSAQFDSNSLTLGGNFYSDFPGANGNPSNGGTPYTSFVNNLNGQPSPTQDRYPYASESLGKVYSIGMRLPSAGSYLASTSTKTISWISQGCVLVDLYLADTNGSAVSTIASNSPDYGHFRWTVPNVTQGSYRIRADCKTSSGALTGKTALGAVFQITPPDLILLSPQSHLIKDSGTPLQISWRKSPAILAVDVYIRYSDAQAFSIVQAGVTADYLTITAPVVSSNRVSVRLAYGGYGDSTDGWFTLRGNSSGSFTAPASTNNLFVGTPALVEWVAPQNTDYVTLDLINGATRNIFTQLGDFSSYLMLVPDVQGAGATLRLTFYNQAGTILQQISSPSQTVLNSSFQPNAIAVSSGSGQSAAVNTAFGSVLRALVTNSSGTGISGVSVTFTAPGSGAGGAFGGSATVVTNGSGIATAPTFTANGVTGTYSVIASTGALSTSFTLTNTAPVLGAQTNIGFLFNGTFVLDANGNGTNNGPPGDKYSFFTAQQAGDIAVVGDWSGNGKTKLGIYRNGFWILDYNGNGVYDYDGTPANDKFLGFGGPANQGIIPVVGDWNGDGRSKIGYYRAGFWVLDYNGNGTYDWAADRVYGFGGNANEFPLLGDWNHDGRTKVGIFYSGNFVLDYDGDGSFTAADKVYPFATYAASDKPVIGDWSGNGFSKIGVYKDGFWILDYNGNGTYDGVSVNQDKVYGFGGINQRPIVGDWNGDGKSKIGFYIDGFWGLDFNGNGSFDGTGVGQDRLLGFGGNPGEQPLLGRW